MKLRVAPWRIVWRFLVVFLVITIILFLSTSAVYFDIDLETWTWTPKPWEFSQVFIIIVLGVVFVTFLVMSLLFYYYKIEDKYFIMKRFGKEYQFEYKNIEFIDIEKSKKKGQVIFYSKTAKMRYMLGDKDGILLETLIKKCPETMSVEDFRRRHPEERY